MQTSLRHAIVLVSVFLGALSFCGGPRGKRQRNVNLRSDPSTGNPAIELIRAKSTVTLLDPAPQNGRYHVRAEDCQGGMGLGREHLLGRKQGFLTLMGPHQGGGAFELSLGLRKREGRRADFARRSMGLFVAATVLSYEHWTPG